MVDRAEGWRASCEYNTDLYDADKRPVILYDIQERLVYAYPYEQYLAELRASEEIASRPA